MSNDFIKFEQDLLTRGRGRLLFEFKNSPVLDQLLQALSIENQELYDAIIDTMNLRTLDNATGVQLDVLGDIVGQYRTAEITNDTIFKQYILAKIFKNQTQAASIPEIRYYIQLIVDEDVSFISPYGLLDLWIVVHEDIPIDVLRMLVSVDNNDKYVGVKYFLPLAATTRLIGVLVLPTDEEVFFTPDLEEGKTDVARGGVIIPVPLI